MGRALQVVSGRVTNPGATITALTADTGDSFAIRSVSEASRVWLTQLWAMAATAGVTRIRSPRMHDQAQGIRARTLASNPGPLLPYEGHQRVYSQDNLVFELSGGGAEVDMASMLLYYEDIDGINARLATWDQIVSQIVNLVGVERNVTTGGTAGDYGGGGALNANFDTLKRNVDYAVLGYLVDAACGTVGLFGPDTGNLRVAGPGVVRSEQTCRWFVQLSKDLGLPCIPIINAANVAATTTDIATPATGATVNVTWILAELSGAGPR